MDSWLNGQHDVSTVSFSLFLVNAPSSLTCFLSSFVTAFMLCYAQEEATSEGITINNIYPIEFLVGKALLLSEWLFA